MGLALSRYLAVYIKDFSSSQFKNWTLHNLGTSLSFLHLHICDHSLLACESLSTQFTSLTSSLVATEFKEDVVQSLAGIPSNFELKKVTCNQIYAKVRETSVFSSTRSDARPFCSCALFSTVLLTITCCCVFERRFQVFRC